VLVALALGRTVGANETEVTATCVWHDTAARLTSLATKWLTRPPATQDNKTTEYEQLLPNVPSNF